METDGWQSIASEKVPSSLVWITFSHDGCRLATGLIDGTLMLWDLSSRGDVKGRRSFPTGLTVTGKFSEDDASLAVACDDGHVRVFDTTTERILHDLSAHRGRVRALAFSRDGTNLATSGEDRRLRVWDLRTERDLLNFPVPSYTLAFSPDGCELIAIHFDGPAVRWTGPRKTCVPLQVTPVKVSLAPDCNGNRNGLEMEASIRSIPVGEPLHNQDLPAVFNSFALYGARRGAVVRPTFDDREDDSGRLLGTLLIKSGHYFDHVYPQSAGVDDIGQRARDVDASVIVRFQTGAYPSFAHGHRTSIVILDPGSFERRDIPQHEMEELDSDRDRFREVHRWAKRHGFAGGFPTFVDNTHDGKTAYGAILIKAEFGEELFLPAIIVWPSDAVPRPLR